MNRIVWTALKQQNDALKGKNERDIEKLIVLCDEKSEEFKLRDNIIQYE